MPDTNILTPRSQPSGSEAPDPRVTRAATAPSLLRLITCGSVDDGKSTLIGRLMFEASGIAEDQLAALRADSKRHGTQGADLDFALLLDGLAAEREQGITIDIGHRYFATPRRRFIVADAPGHVQYTRNMATAASMASLAILLVDARAGLLDQTRRHSLIVAMLGVRQIVLAINKMDLVDFSQARFDEIERSYRAFATNLASQPLDIVCIPISAKRGDNVTSRSQATPWYNGPILLEHLEQVEPDAVAKDAPFRLPVQWVNRPDESFRGYAGRIASGTIHPGDTIRAQPSGKETRIARIVTADGDLLEAHSGQSVTLTLEDELDISRGDMLTLAGQAPPLVADELTARILWVDAEPAVPMRSYLMKIGTANVPARLDPPRATLNIETGVMVPAAAAAMPGLNEIARLPVRLDRAVVFDGYVDNPGTGGFILIDRATNMTVAMGMIEASGISRPSQAKGFRAWVARVRERPWRSLAKAVSWRTTGSIDTFVLTWLVSGSAKLAASVGGFEVFTKIFLYFVHERIWARIPLGLKRM